MGLVIEDINLVDMPTPGGKKWEGETLGEFVKHIQYVLGRNHGISLAEINEELEEYGIEPITEEQIWFEDMGEKKRVNELADQVESGEIKYLHELKQICKFKGVEWVDVLEYTEYNVCDRCGKLVESDDLFWTMDAEALQMNNADLWTALERHKDEYYDALCESCVNELTAEIKLEREI